MAPRALTRSEVGLVRELIGGPPGAAGGRLTRAGRRVETLPPLWGALVLIGVVVAIYCGALGGLSLALADASSVVLACSGAAVMLVSAAVASHLTPGRAPVLLE